MIGNRVILQPGVVIGSDGFGYEFRDGRQQRIPQTGIVQIDDDVEIGQTRPWIARGLDGRGSKRVSRSTILFRLLTMLPLAATSVICRRWEFQAARGWATM